MAEENHGLNNADTTNTDTANKEKDKKSKSADLSGDCSKNEVTQYILEVEAKDICFETFVNGEPSLASPFSTEFFSGKLSASINDQLHIGRNTIDAMTTMACPTSSLKLTVYCADKAQFRYEWPNAEQPVYSLPARIPEEANILTIPKKTVLKMKINLKERLAGLKKSFWKPSVKSGDGGLTDSKYGGIPYIAKGEPWPACRSCSAPLQFFLQLNLSELTSTLGWPFGTGLLQLFVCVSRQPGCYNAPFVRVVQPVVSSEDSKSQEKIRLPDTGVKIKPKKIVKWKEGSEYPDFYTMLNILGIDSSSDLTASLEKYREKYPAQGDKLCGWRFMLQMGEEPECPICGKRMPLLFQLFSDINVEYMFGDGGAMYVFQCEEHREQVDAYWECN
ncbi:MAG: DUF1963 domain-containing protein [Thermoplasmata archaeon]